MDHLHFAKVSRHFAEKRVFSAGPEAVLKIFRIEEHDFHRTGPVLDEQPEHLFPAASVPVVHHELYLACHDRVLILRRIAYIDAVSPVLIASRQEEHEILHRADTQLFQSFCLFRPYAFQRCDTFP